MSITTYHTNISVGNVQLNTIQASTDLISQAASLMPSTSNAAIIMQWINKIVNTRTPVSGVQPFWSNVYSTKNYFQVSVPNNGSSTPTNGGWSGCVTLPDGRVIVAPQIPTSTPYIGIFNPVTNQFTTVSAPNAGSDYVYAGTNVVAPDGRVIFGPFRTAAIGIFNPVTNIFTTTSGGLTGNPRHAGACLLPNGTIMFGPYEGSSIGLFDPTTNIYTTGPVALGTNAYAGCVPLPDGRVILCPNNGTTIGIYNYLTNSYTQASGITGVVSGAYFGGNLLPDGTVAFIPYSTSSPNIGLYNPNTNIFTTVATGAGGFQGGRLLSNGLLFCNPFNTTYYGIYNYLTKSFTTGPTGSTSTQLCQSSGQLLDGRLITPPFLNNSNMGIYIGSTIPPPPEFILHPLFNHGS